MNQFYQRKSRLIEHWLLLIVNIETIFNSVSDQKTKKDKGVIIIKNEIYLKTHLSREFFPVFFLRIRNYDSTKWNN